jgi:serine/threonine protein kinase
VTTRCRRRSAPRHTDPALLRTPGPAGGALLAGRYRLAERVGRGASADVWRARDELLDRDVAVKQFHEPHTHSLIEARLAARVRHPNVAAVHDVVGHGSAYSLVMDYCGGTNLVALLRGEGRLPESVVAVLGLQLLAALQAVHASGVVHCDVKPANLMLDDDGRLVLIDFGIAEINGSDPAHPARRSGDVIGSPAYMAPELVLGGAPRPASDLWSLAATLYTAVEGLPPFRQDDDVPTLTAVLHDPPSPTRRAGRLQPVLDRLLVKEPADRASPDVVHVLLTDACPTTPPVLTAQRTAPDRDGAEPTISTPIPRLLGPSWGNVGWGRRLIGTA